MTRSIFWIFVFTAILTRQFPLVAMDEDDALFLVKRGGDRDALTAIILEKHSAPPPVPPTPASSPVPQKKGPTVFPPPLLPSVGKGPLPPQISIQTSSPTAVDLPLMLLGLGSRPVGDTPRSSRPERMGDERPMAPFPGMEYAGDDADGEAIFSPRTPLMVAGQETMQAVKPPFHRRRRSAAYHVPPLASTVVTQQAGLETDGDE